MPSSQKKKGGTTYEIQSKLDNTQGSTSMIARELFPGLKEDRSPIKGEELYDLN